MNDTALEALLSRHFRSPPMPEDDEQLQRLAHALSCAPGAAERDAMQDTLRSDPQLQRAVELVQAEAETPADKPNIAPWRIARPWLSMVAVAAAGLLSFVALRATGPQAPAMRVKGAGDMLFVGADREGQRTQVRAMDVIAPGDELGFFYSAERPGYLVIGYRDESGEALIVEPAQSELARPVAPGEHVALPDGVVVEQGSGCEWFVAGFFDAAVPVAELRDALAAATFDSKGCILHMQVPAARSVSVLPTRRP